MSLFGTSGPSLRIAPCTLTRWEANFDEIGSRFRAPSGGAGVVHSSFAVAVASQLVGHFSDMPSQHDDARPPGQSRQP
jgi:hypothetical protein